MTGVEIHLLCGALEWVEGAVAMHARLRLWEEEEEENGIGVVELKELLKCQAREGHKNARTWSLFYLI